MRSDPEEPAKPETPAYVWDCVTLEADFAGRDGAGALVFKGRVRLLAG